MHSLAEVYNRQYQGSKNPPQQKKEQPKTAQVNVVLHMPEVGMLIRHLDLLFVFKNQKDKGVVNGL